METEQLIRILEGALLAAGKPLTVQQIADLFEEGERPEAEQIRQALQTLTEQCEGRGFELKQVASGYRFQVREEVAPWVGRLWEEKPQRYSRALLETLALIAYRQPITRGDIEDIRGVAVSSQIIKTLLEREWVRVVGHKDVPGRPAMYATTRKFLDYFNLRNLDDLPALADIKDLDNLSGELGFDDSNGEATAEEPPAEQPAGDLVDGEAGDDVTLQDSGEAGAVDDPTVDEFSEEVSDKAYDGDQALALESSDEEATSEDEDYFDQDADAESDADFRS